MQKCTLLALVAGLLAIAPMARAEDALYKSLGGKKAITAVVDDFVARVAGDKRINSFFKATASDPKRLADFDALVKDLVASLDKFMVKDGDKQAVLGVLGPMKKDIVEK